MTHITKHLEVLNQRIKAACAAANRNENEVSILAVSKRHSVAAIRDAASAGLKTMGENYVQEALEKIPQLGADIEWHFIGRIQSNKTRAVAEHFSWVQTVASQKIAQRLNDQRPADLPRLNVCVQVDTDGTGAHGGIPPADVAGLCAFIAEEPRLRLRGLMTIPLATQNQQEQRYAFHAVRELYDELRAGGTPLDTLSMGMSNDLEAAIAEGSTMIRVGTALFGPRSG